jgi:hypothetical protein
VKLTHAAPQDPRVLLVQPGVQLRWFKYVTLIGACVGIGASLDFIFRRAPQIAPVHDQEIYAGLAASLFVLAVSVISVVYVRMWPPPPFKAGTYVFPSSLVAMRGGYLDITPIAELGRPTVVTVRRNGAYSGSRLELGNGFTFYFGSEASVNKACTEVLEARERFKRLLETFDEAEIVAVDPFAECTLAKKWSWPPNDLHPGPLVPVVPGVARFVQWGAPLLLAAGIAAGLYVYVDTAYAPQRAAYDLRR